jgi:hypothetical protein
MDAPRALTLACGALLWALLTAGSCATTPPPPAKANAKPPEPPAAEPAPKPTPPAEPAPAPSTEPPAKDKDVEVVIDPGGAKAPVSLLEAGRAERERRANSGPPVAVITDKNLKEYAAKGQLTVADVRKSKPQPAAAPAPEGAEPVHDEQYWRSRSREIRARWKATAEELKKLEASAAGLRRSFYAEDDPYVRDSKVKPEWDRVLDRLQETRDEVETVKKELADFEEQGRREGALPGWLREGAELVPEAEKKKNGLDEHKPIEPPDYVPSEPPPTK